MRGRAIIRIQHRGRAQFTPRARPRGELRYCLRGSNHPNTAERARARHAASTSAGEAPARGINQAPARDQAASGRARDSGRAGERRKSRSQLKHRHASRAAGLIAATLSSSLFSGESRQKAGKVGSGPFHGLEVHGGLESIAPGAPGTRIFRRATRANRQADIIRQPADPMARGKIISPPRHKLEMGGYIIITIIFYRAQIENMEAGKK